MKIDLLERREIDVSYLKADCGVRYWEDAEVNGVEDTEGDLIPCRNGDSWAPVINLDTGVIEGWPQGTKAKVHYKVCDAGVYTLLDANMNPVKKISDYVPGMLSPGGCGYGDYVIMNIDASGKIDNWAADLDPFERDED